MSCVSSTFLSQDDEFSQIGGSTAAFSHHIVSLTSTTYGLLTFDPPPSANSRQHLPTTTVPPTPSPPTRTTLGSLFPSPLSKPCSVKYHPLESINTWDLMFGLDADHIPNFRLSLLPSIHTKPYDPPVNKQASTQLSNEENICPNVSLIQSSSEANTSRKSFVNDSNHGAYFLDRFELICPPNGENKVVIYTTTLRGIEEDF